MQLCELQALLTTSRLVGEGNVQISGIQFDSRKVKSGDLFICIPGLVTDGHLYAHKAVEQGAAALVLERDVEANVPKLFVSDSRYAMAVIASHFYHYPSREMKLIGVTGTNGKTTTTYLIERILHDNSFKTGLMGTVKMKIGNEEFPMERTTQEALEIQHHLHLMKAADTDYCVMEVSSHALELGRVKGCRFRTAVFTNLTQDHLDFHGTMENYRAAKGLFFARLGNEFAPDPEERTFAVLNADDPASPYFKEQTSAQVITYGIDNEADVRGSHIRVTSEGTFVSVETFRGKISLHLKLVGKFNVYNALGAIAATLLEGLPLEQIKNSLEKIDAVEGRMESVNCGQPFLVLVDYAHTPDGLENALSTIREFAKGRVITVFGCGGDRDRTKRPIMGNIAERYSDFVFITSDNPRSENPESILKDVEQGLSEAGSDHYEMIVDRKIAIQRAIEMADANDVVLIAGKGHETYQIIGTAIIDFDDREMAREAIRGLNS